MPWVRPPDDRLGPVPRAPTLAELDGGGRIKRTAGGRMVLVDEEDDPFDEGDGDPEPLDFEPGRRARR